MSTRLLLQGTDIEELLEQIRSEHGSAARIVRAERIRTGGVAGFFAKERFEVSVEVAATEAETAPAQTAGRPFPLDTALPGDTSLPRNTALPRDTALPTGSAAARIPRLPAEPAMSTPALSTPALSTPALSTPALSTPAMPTPAVPSPAAPRLAAPDDSAGPLAMRLLAAYDQQDRLESFTAAQATAPTAESLPGPMAVSVAASAPAAGAAPTATHAPAPLVGTARATDAAPSSFVPLFAAERTDELLDDGFAAVLARLAAAQVARSAQETSAEIPSPPTDVTAAAAATPTQPSTGPIPDGPIPADAAALIPAESAASDVEPTSSAAAAAATQPAPNPAASPAAKTRPASAAKNGRKPTTRPALATASPLAATSAVAPGVSQLPVETMATPAPPRGPGQVLAFVGAAEAAYAAATEQARRMRVPGTRVLLASPEPIAARVPPARRLADPAAALGKAATFPTSGGVTIVAVDAPLSVGWDPEVASWTRGLIAALAPEAIWAVVDATRKPADLTDWLTALGRVDAIAVQNAAATRDFSTVTSLGVPVATVDGRPPRRGELSAARPLTVGADTDWGVA